jgi:hypothetical protein
MIRSKVQSSLITAIGHDPDNQLLQVEFPPRKGEEVGSVYEYSNVTRSDAEALLDAESIGRHFQVVIKPFPQRFPFRKLSAEEAKQ